MSRGGIERFMIYLHFSNGNKEISWRSLNPKWLTFTRCFRSVVWACGRWDCGSWIDVMSQNIVGKNALEVESIEKLFTAPPARLDVKDVDCRWRVCGW